MSGISTKIQVHDLKSMMTPARAENDKRRPGCTLTVMFENPPTRSNEPVQPAYWVKHLSGLSNGYIQAILALDLESAPPEKPKLNILFDSTANGFDVMQMITIESKQATMYREGTKNNVIGISVKSAMRELRLVRVCPALDSRLNRLQELGSFLETKCSWIVLEMHRVRRDDVCTGEIRVLVLQAIDATPIDLVSIAPDDIREAHVQFYRSNWFPQLDAEKSNALWDEYMSVEISFRGAMRVLQKIYAKKLAEEPFAFYFIWFFLCIIGLLMLCEEKGDRSYVEKIE